MSSLALFFFSGLGQGAVFAALAVGLIVTYKGTGVINFAAGAMGVWVAFVFFELRDSGDLVLPVGTISLGSGLDLPLAISIAVANAIGLGLLVYTIVFRPLRSAPLLARTVASAGLMLAIQALVDLRFGSSSRVVPAVLPTETVRMGGGGFSRDRLWLTAVVVVLAAVIGQWFRRTRTGRAVRAASENERAASLAGLSPDFLAAVTWALASGFIGFVAVLAAPMTGLNSTTFTLFIVPALASALVGGLVSIAPAVAAGLALGAINSEITYFAGLSWWPSWATPGVASAIPMIVVVVVLYVRGKSLPTRDFLRAGRLPVVTRAKLRPLTVGVCVAVALVALFATSGSYRFGIIFSLAVSLAMLSFVVLTGFVGQVSLAQASFAGLAGFALSKLTVNWGVGFPWAPLIAAAGATVLGLLIGTSALRIRGAQLAVVTLTIALAFEQTILNNNKLSGSAGNPIKSPQLFGVDLAMHRGQETARWQFGLLVLVIVVLACLAISNLARSNTGRQFLAVRSNERASAAVGVNVTQTKLFAFGVSAFLAGLSGTLIAYSNGSVSIASFSVLIGVSWLVYAYLGGVGSISGALVAGTMAPLAITFVIFDRLGASGSLYLFVSACALLLTTILNPQGIAGGVKDQLAWVKAHRKGKVTATPGAGAEPGRPAPRRPATPVERGAPGNVVLETLDLGVRFGGLRALGDVNIIVRANEIVGLIGANGAGKTTFIDAITGFVPYTGSVRVDDAPVDELAAHARARRGVVRTWQSLELFEDLTVRENVAIATQRTSLVSSLADAVVPGRVPHPAEVDEVMAMLGLEDAGSQAPSSLSLGHQKLVNVARAAAARPHVLLLDEPAAGLSTAETRDLSDALRSIVTPEMGVLLIEHDTAMVFELCDRVYVLDHGQIIEQGHPDDVRGSEAVIAAYLGVAGPMTQVEASTDPAEVGS